MSDDEVFPHGCDERELNQPDEKCASCGEWIAWAYGIKFVWFGVCRCPVTLWRWHGDKEKLLRLHIKGGFIRSFEWVEVALTELSSS